MFAVAFASHPARRKANVEVVPGTDRICLNVLLFLHLPSEPIG